MPFGQFKAFSDDIIENNKVVGKKVRNPVLKSVRTLVTMPEYWPKDLTVWFKMKTLLLMMTNSHSF